MTSMPKLPTEALQRLTRIEVAAQTAQQSANFSVSRVSDIDNAFNLSPDRSDGEVLRIERAELVAQRKHLKEKADASANLLANIRQYLQHIFANRPNVIFEYAPTMPVAPRRGETVAKALERVRGAILDNKTLQRKIATAPLPKEDLKAMASAWVDRISTQLHPTYQIEEGLMRVDVGVGDAIGGLSPRHVLGLICMVAPGNVLALLERTIDSKPDHPDSLPDHERRERLHALAEELDTLEREEEAVVLHAWSNARTDIHRRSDASPQAILGIRIKSAAKKLNGSNKLNGAKKSEPRIKLLPKHQAALDTKDEDATAAQN